MGPLDVIFLTSQSKERLERPKKLETERCANCVNYGKPEVKLFVGVVVDVQRPYDKSEHDVADCDLHNPVLGRVSAYAADE